MYMQRSNLILLDSGVAGFEGVYTLRGRGATAFSYARDVQISFGKYLVSGVGKSEGTIVISCICSNGAEACPIWPRPVQSRTVITPSCSVREALCSTGLTRSSYCGIFGIVYALMICRMHMENFHWWCSLYRTPIWSPCTRSVV